MYIKNRIKSLHSKLLNISRIIIKVFIITRLRGRKLVMILIMQVSKAKDLKSYLWILHLGLHYKLILSNLIVLTQKYNQNSRHMLKHQEALLLIITKRITLLNYLENHPEEVGSYNYRAQGNLRGKYLISKL